MDISGSMNIYIFILELSMNLKKIFLILERKIDRQGGKHGAENSGAEISLHELEDERQIDIGLYYTINYSNNNF